MKLRSFGILVLGSILQAIGSGALKYSIAMKNMSYPMSMSIAGEVAAIVLIISGFPLYKTGLAKLKLSIAQPVYSSVLFLTSILISFVIFHDAIHMNEIAGLGILILGIFIVIRTY